MSIRYWNGKQHRKIRKDADASYFVPDYCEVVISFVPSEDPHDEDGPGNGSLPDGDDGKDGAFDREAAMDQLLEALAESKARGGSWLLDGSAINTCPSAVTAGRAIRGSAVPCCAARPSSA